MKTEEEQQQYLQGLYDKAVERFTVTGDRTTREVAWVEAEASTGSRYEVLVARLHPDVAQTRGAEAIVAVLQPWQTAYPLGSLDPVHPNYVAEKWLRPGREFRDVHWGDWAAITLTINEAIKLLKEAGEQ